MAGGQGAFDRDSFGNGLWNLIKAKEAIIYVVALSPFLLRNLGNLV